MLFDLYRRRSSGELVELPHHETLGVGGEARVHPYGPDLAAKVYHQPSAERAAKLEVMLSNPPDIPISNQGHVMIAWPIDLLEDPESGEVVGYLMDRVAATRQLVDVYNPKIRQRVAPGFHTAYLLRTACNLAVSVEALHSIGYVIGDLNETNVLVKDTALITLVDLDSIQVVDPDSARMFPCPVGKVEFTAPEAQEQDFATFARTVEHDRFALAVLIFHLLMEGTHPFAGTSTAGGEPKPLGTRIREGLFPYHGSLDLGYAPRPTSPKLDALHPEIRALLRRCFEEGLHDPKARPHASHWVAATRAAEADLRICGRNPQHRYDQRQSRCPWCVRTVQLHGYDAFPKLADGQRDEAELESAVANRVLRKKKAKQQREVARALAAALPLLLIGIGVLLYKTLHATTPPEREPLTQASAVEQRQGAEAAPEDKSPGGHALSRRIGGADPSGSDSPSSQTGGEPTAGGQAQSAVAHRGAPPAAQSATAGKLDASVAPAHAEATPTTEPALPSGAFPPAIHAVRAKLVGTAARLGGDAAMTGYVLRGALASSTVWDLATTDDAVWVSTDRGLLRVDGNTREIELHDATPDFRSRPYRAIAGLPRGLATSYHGFPGGTRLLDEEAHTWRQVAGAADCLAGDRVFLWSGSGHGLLRTDMRIEGGEPPRTYSRTGGQLPGDDVVAVATGLDEVWIARRSDAGDPQRGGVSRLDTNTGTWEHFGKAQGLAADSTIGLAVDDLAVWTVHDGPGISRFDRKTRRWQVIRIGVAARTGAPQTILTGRALAVERHYNVWIGGAGDLGLFWYGATSRKARRVLRMPGREVVAVTVGHGAVWALFRRAPGSKEPSVLVRIGSDRSAQHQRERNQEATRRAYQELALSHTGSNPPTVVAAVRAARTWLIRHQERDGRFDADGFARHDPAGQRCDGAGRPGNDACTTALAVLAMLPRSPSDDTEPAVRRGIDAAAQWLIRQQVRTSGHIRGGTGRTAPFGHAVATLALLRTYAAFGNARIRSAAELAVRDLQRTQLDGQGWRFGANDRHSDPSVTAWAIEALVTAAELGFSIDTKRLGAALAFLDETTFGGTLRSGRTAAEPVAALYARTLLGQRQSNTAAVRSAFESLRTNEVRWSPGDVDLLAWYFGSHATSRLDGSEQAQQKYHRVLLDAQCTQGSAAGSWDPIGTWGEQGGRSFATALGTLVLNASRHIANSHPGGQLSGDPRLDSLRTLDEPTYAALARALRGLGSKFQAKSMKDALVIRQLQRTWSIAIAAAGRILAQVERGDPMRIAGRTRQLAEDFAGLPQGETARAAVERWRRDPVLRRELDAAQRLTELRAKHRDSATPAYLDAVEEFVGRNLEARCAAPLVDELLSRNTVRGTARRPAGARVLEAPRPRADQVALVLGDAPEQRAALTIPARWWQDPTAPGLAFVDPEDPQERLRISVHRGKTSPEVAKRMPSPSSTELATTATGNTVRTSAIRAGNRRLPCQMWTFRTPTDPKSVRRVALLEVQGSVVELELVSRRGAAELTRILASIRTGARYATQDSFQARIGGWLLQGSLPDLAPASAEGGELVWHERDRSGKHIATFRLHAAAANSASLVAHATSARARLAGGTAVWQAQLRRSPRDPHWLIYSHQDGGTQQAMAITRIEGTLDLMVTYRGPDSSLTKLQRVVAALRGKPVPESR